ncbi:NAD(P)-binding protein [Aulographum hederae CBS 113979]|uniref:NAD(P)-binding protein n=1 Tax=Aulographum hederae CBS 113979 TaxID=1176131 RepID=A0A6G1HEK8_9PEZI|nr:NAD(P)-binding protein [Aulographum hederae CBS 113979]
MSSSQVQTPFNPSRSIFPETLGKAVSTQRLRNRRILVVGAGQPTKVDPYAPKAGTEPISNGRAISLLFAREGATIVCLDSRLNAPSATVEQISAEGGSAHALDFDVRADAEDIPSAVDKAKALLGGRLDGIVLCLGISRVLPLGKGTGQGWDEELAATVRAHVLFTQRVLEKDVLAPGGSVVVLSSVAGQRGGRGELVHESSRAALAAIVKGAAREGASKGVRVNGVSPGWVDAPTMFDASSTKNPVAKAPFGRQATAWEIAYTSLFLMSHESTYISGISINMDGGHYARVDGGASASKL